MIGDVAGEIRQLAVAFDDRAIFIVAEAASIDTIPRRPANRAAVGRSRSIASATSLRSRMAFSLKNESNSMPKSFQLRANRVEQRIAAELAKKVHRLVSRSACKYLSPYCR